MLIRLLWLFLLIQNFDEGHAQYIHNVLIPDKSMSRVADITDSSVRYASGISPSTLRDHLKVIASDSMEGRETGKRGMHLASEYLQKQIRNLGLSSVPGTNNYYQNIAFTFSKWNETYLRINDLSFRYLWDYIMIPEDNRDMGEINASEVVFLGYGIDDQKYSDYKKINVKDKVILIYKGEPVKKNGNSVITGSQEMSSWSSDLNKKLIAAKSNGVKLVLIIEDDIKKLLDVNRRKLLMGSTELGITTQKTYSTANHIYISSTIAKAIIGENEKKINSARSKFENGKPVQIALKTSLKLNMSKDVTILEGQNVVGYIKGRTKPDEFIIVSAHYDHLGMRNGEIYNGANDNGSGTVTLLELAQACQQAVMEGNPPQRSIVFLWFCGEEKGLLGSQYYSENPIFPLQNTILNINIDMLGRPDEKYKHDPDYTYIIGSDRLSSDLHKINEEANQKYTHLTLDYTYNDEDDPNRYYYRSDHYNFARRGVPAIFFFNGTNEDYHRTTDDVEKINFDAMANVAKLIFHTLWEVANRKERIIVDGEIK